MDTEVSPLMRSALDATTRRLAGRFRGVFSEETIARCVEDSFERIGDRPTAGPNLTPIFVERFASRAAAGSRTVRGDRRKGDARAPVRVRAQRRAQPDGGGAGARALGGSVAVRSAGTSPVERIDPVVVEAMSEIAVDIRLSSPSR